MKDSDKKIYEIFIIFDKNYGKAIQIFPKGWNNRFTIPERYLLKNHIWTIVYSYSETLGSDYETDLLFCDKEMTIPLIKK